ncbi:MAG: DUF1501 domain-containing protein [Myxococcales bacterium]|nr:DUF1501 domain-containing protein [Myxococcales bacterium]
MRRRDFLAASAAVGAAFGVPLRALADEGRNRKFIFVFARGGWDPTCALAPAFHTVADTEPEAERATIGDLTYVDHPARPSVRAFFESAHSRAAILRGILVPSIAHEQCTRLLMTGSNDDGLADWGAILAHAGNDYLLPELVASGPSFAGPYGRAVARMGTNGQLGQLLSGRPVTAGLRGMSDDAASAVDRVLARRAAARTTRAQAASEVVLAEAFESSVERLDDLRKVDDSLSLGARFTLEDQLELAVQALATRTSRCAMAATAGSWDTHTNNALGQSPLWESLFADLIRLDALLQTTPGPTGAPLSDDTMVVVLSEMGRTPRLNADAGKDHWPYTSALLFGAGVRGGSVVGGYDEAYDGLEVEGVTLSANRLGATLLAAADLDPAEWVGGATPLTQVLA